jgi:hypothetical protein
MKKITHQADFCVIGGGLAGMCAAIAAARRGIKTILMHDRPVLGGNASSEIRMWVCGARGKNNLETGIIEEIRLENLYRNNHPNFSIWDSILYEKVHFQKNLTLLLNTSCNQVQMSGKRISCITGWQLTTETFHTVESDFFADCSGDSILAPLSGAEFRIGREARNEFDESIAPEASDIKTMGMSCLIQARETNSPQKFIPPAWANKYLSDESLLRREHSLEGTNFWWMELGGENDSIHDTEMLRDELLKIAFGVWDHIKNHGDHGAANWVLDWLGFLPGKRESRRYAGDYIMTQNDVDSGGNFDDIVAYGGWTMDDHNPAGINHLGAPTIHHPAPSPYGIPFRSLYSKNIDNLFFAGRNISVTHCAMSSTRVMATCALLGQAIGTAAALAVKNDMSPRGVYQNALKELQQNLMDDDCWLPGFSRNIPELSENAIIHSSGGNPEPLRNGIDRPVGNYDNCWDGGVGDWVEYRFNNDVKISQVRIIFDSNLNRPHLNAVAKYPLEMPVFSPPETLIKGFHIEVENCSSEIFEVHRENNNYQRFVLLNFSITARRVRLCIDEVYGTGNKRIFAFDLDAIHSCIPAYGVS